MTRTPGFPNLNKATADLDRIQAEFSSSNKNLISSAERAQGIAKNAISLAGNLKGRIDEALPHTRDVLTHSDSATKEIDAILRDLPAASPIPDHMMKAREHTREAYKSGRLIEMTLTGSGVALPVYDEPSKAKKGIKIGAIALGTLFAAAGAVKVASIIEDNVTLDCDSPWNKDDVKYKQKCIDVTDPDKPTPVDPVDPTPEEPIQASPVCNPKHPYFDLFDDFCSAEGYNIESNVQTIGKWYFDLSKDIQDKIDEPNHFRGQVNGDMEDGEVVGVVHHADDEKGIYTIQFVSYGLDEKYHIGTPIEVDQDQYMESISKLERAREK